MKELAWAVCLLVSGAFAQLGSSPLQQEPFPPKLILPTAYRQSAQETLEALDALAQTSNSAEPAFGPLLAKARQKTEALVKRSVTGDEQPFGWGVQRLLQKIVACRSNVPLTPHIQDCTIDELSWREKLVSAADLRSVKAASVPAKATKK